MQTKFKDGSVMVLGGCSKDAELKRVGQDGKRICKVGLAVGKREDDSTIWVNVVAWHDVASVLSTALRGQQVLAIGHIKEREYNGKKYTDLVADYVSVCAPPQDKQKEYDTRPSDKFTDLGDEDSSELPF